MKISFSLLKQYVNLEKLQASEIADTLTLLGIEVEGIENEKASFSGVVAAKVESTERHPNADKLTIATVFDGSNFYKVVCGAKNCRPGIKTAFAKIGAVLTDEDKKIEIKKAKLRDVESFGMLCSKKELGLGDGEGIIELAEDVELGLDLSATINPIFDISLTPNLGHCMSVIGIARELGAYLNKKVQYPSLQYFPDPSLKSDIKVKVEEGCIRYSGLVIKNITVQPSPAWLSDALEASGIRPINNIVDVLNFVMTEMGQPMHSFDFQKIEKEISVSLLKKEENFLSLDSIERKIPKDSLVIKDSEKILAVAGVIGGMSSAVNNETTSIFIESASFDPLLVRKTGKNFGLRSESSLRFEKGTDPNVTIKALSRAAHLIQKICPECKIGSIIDVKEKEFKPLKISCRSSRVNKIIGINLSVNEIESIFKRLECGTSRLDDEIVIVEVPTYRNDLKNEIDLVEEVARIYGYNNIERKPPLFSSSSIGHSPLYVFENKLKKIFTSLGMQELITSDLISPKMAQVIVEKSLPKSAIIEVLYSKSEDKSHLRPSLLPSFLEIAKYNFDHKNFDISAFEISKIHLKKQDEFIEEPVSALMLTGKNRPHHFDLKPLEYDFYDIKGILENLFNSLKIENFSFTKSSHPCFHPGRQAKIFIEKMEIGVVGEVHPSILLEFDLKKPILFAEINTHELLKNQKKDAKYSALPQFPASERDWTVSVEGEIPIVSLLEKISSPILEEAYLLDIYMDPKKENVKNMTIRFVYRDKNKTVSFDEVEKEQEKITSAISKSIKELEKRSHNN
jgi:phenylalanyl-tRNA synthetase beta chain